MTTEDNSGHLFAPVKIGPHALQNRIVMAPLTRSRAIGNIPNDRRSVAYTVVQPDESRVLGCVYIVPTRKRDYDAEVYLGHARANLPAGSKSGSMG